MTAGLRILLVAEESAGVQVLRALAKSPHEVVSVLTAPPTRGGGASVASVAQTLGIPIEPSERVKEAETGDWVRSHDVDLLLNVHSLYVLHGEVLSAPRIGSFNLHPGPLPEYAGLNTPSWAVYRQEPAHGVTLHWMEPGIDTGPIAYEARFPIGEADTGLSVSARCVREGLPLVEQLLEEAASADGTTIPARPQDLTRRRYFGRRPPQEGEVDWNRPASEIVAFVRACDYYPFPSPWGHPETQNSRGRLAVVRAARSGSATAEPPGVVGAAGDGGVHVAAADEWVVVHRVEADDRIRDAAEVLRSGDVLTNP